jgi:hypothetical protein
VDNINNFVKKVKGNCVWAYRLQGFLTPKMEFVGYMFYGVSEDGTSHSPAIIYTHYKVHIGDGTKPAVMYVIHGSCGVIPI